MNIILIIGAIVIALITWLLSKISFNSEVKLLTEALNIMKYDYSDLNNKLKYYDERNEEYKVVFKENKELIETKLFLSQELHNVNANLNAYKEALTEKIKEKDELNHRATILNNELNDTKYQLAHANAVNKSNSEKLDTQKNEIEKMNQKLTSEFENIANKILEEKSTKFTDLNKVNLNSILEPLGKDIELFKKKVEETYEKENITRNSLADKVVDLIEKTNSISLDAQNLTKALKGETKTQGNWGEMILAKVLESSGLIKGTHYLTEAELKDNDNKALKSQYEDKKMRPDAILLYPGHREIIVDSKVSINAFIRMCEATDENVKRTEILQHIQDIKNHIISLSTKGYDDYDKTLDFVMMFIPNESAYIVAIQNDSELWNFAYSKRVLLMSPSNLITSLKLIYDLWKRDAQNKNAIQIAERGAKLHTKFKLFINNLRLVGDSIDKAKFKYDDAYKQLTTGNDNLVSQAKKLEDLGIKTKANIIIESDETDETDEEIEVETEPETPLELS